MLAAVLGFSAGVLSIQRETEQCIRHSDIFFGPVVGAWDLVLGEHMNVLVGGEEEVII